MFFWVKFYNNSTTLQFPSTNSLVRRSLLVFSSSSGLGNFLVGNSCVIQQVFLIKQFYSIHDSAVLIIFKFPEKSFP